MRFILSGFDRNVAQLFSEMSLPVPLTCCKEQTKALVPALHAGQLIIHWELGQA